MVTVKRSYDRTENDLRLQDWNINTDISALDDVSEVVTDLMDFLERAPKLREWLKSRVTVEEHAIKCVAEACSDAVLNNLDGMDGEGVDIYISPTRKQLSVVAHLPLSENGPGYECDLFELIDDFVASESASVPEHRRALKLLLKILSKCGGSVLAALAEGRPGKKATS